MRLFVVVYKLVIVVEYVVVQYTRVPNFIDIGRSIEELNNIFCCLRRFVVVYKLVIVGLLNWCSTPVYNISLL